jgi:hypothetical protein
VKWRFLGLFPASVHQCKRRGEVRHQHPQLAVSNPPSSLLSVLSLKTSISPAMSRYAQSTDSFSSLKLASFFAQLRAALGVSPYRPSFCCSRVWLRFSLFLLRVRRSVPVSKAACRDGPNFVPSWCLPSVHPDISVNRSYSPRRRNRVQPVQSLSALQFVAMTSRRRRPPRASPSSSRIRVSKEPRRPEATPLHFKYATSPGQSCRPGRLESGFCDPSSES